MRLSGNVAASLTEIVEKVRHVDLLVAQIALASHEQSQGIAQVNQAVSQMDKVTQTNAATAEESASASEELNSQAAVLKSAANELLALVGGQAATGKTAAEITAVLPPKIAAKRPHVRPTSAMPAPARHARIADNLSFN